MSFICIVRAGDEEKRVGGKRKQSLQHRRKQVTKHPEDDAFHESICHLTMHVTCSAVSLDQIGAKNAHETFRKTWPLFA